MPDKKLTDNEIITTLNEADGMEHIAIFCADGKGENTKSIPMVDIIDLINSQKAETESLQSRNTFLEIEFKNISNLFESRLNKAKTEAYKEFAERLLACYEDFDEENEIITYLNLVTGVKDVLKELVGDSSAD